MKTKEGLVLDFMMALASNGALIKELDPKYEDNWAKEIREYSEELAWQYIKWINGETE